MHEQETVGSESITITNSLKTFHTNSQINIEVDVEIIFCKLNDIKIDD